MTVTIRALGEAVAEIYGIDVWEMRAGSSDPRVEAARGATLWAGHGILVEPLDAAARLLGTTPQAAAAALNALLSADRVDPLAVEARTAAMSLAALDELPTVDLPAELDATAIAVRIQNAPGSAVRVTVDEIRALAAHVIAEARRAAEKRVNAVEVPVVPRELVGAIRQSIAAAKTFDAALYTRGEQEAAKAVVRAGKALETTFETILRSR